MSNAITTSADQDNKSEIEADAYAVIDATNEDGTIDAEIINVPERQGDKVVFDILPLIPTEDSYEIQMDWPKKDNKSYDIVKLCDNLVGGFQSIAQLKNKKVKIEMNSDKPEIKIDDDTSRLKSFISIIQNKRSDRSLVYGVVQLTRILSVIGIILPFVLLLALPWGIYLISAVQGMSVFIAGIVVLFISTMVLDGIENN